MKCGKWQKLSRKIKQVYATLQSCLSNTLYKKNLFRSSASKKVLTMPLVSVPHMTTLVAASPSAVTRTVEHG